MAGWTVTSPMAGTVVDVAVQVGDELQPGVRLLSLESMKLEHPVELTAPGRVERLLVAPGDVVERGQALVRLATPAEAADVADHPSAAQAAPDGTDTDPTAIAPAPTLTDAQPTTEPAPATTPERADFAEVRARRAGLLDAARPAAVAARAAQGRRTARANIAALVDPGSFSEYGGLAIAAQRRRREVAELIEQTPADGLVGGTATIAADRLGPAAARCVVLAYDATVLAGTQGQINHRKTDRLFELAARERLPVVLFAEGGGGRPGDTDAAGASWLTAMAFHLLAKLSGQVPIIAVVDGYCFAGNAALAGCADVLIATEGSNLGMAGPAMIEGGGLGRVEPTDIGPIAVQRANGVVDIVVRDDVEAVHRARQVFVLLRPPRAAGRGAGDHEPGAPGRPDRTGARIDVEVAHPEQASLRDLVPPDRRRAYAMRPVLTTLVDTDSYVELRADAAPGMITALAAIGGHPIGLLANDPHHLGGAIDAEAADSAVRHLELCEAHGLPVVVLCDTPGFMVGPEAERDGGVRRFAAMFVAGARLTVPIVAVVVRKGYGLGAQAMVGGHLQVPVLTVAWPTGELGPMGLEGAVRLGYRRELATIDDAAERAAAEERMITQAHAHAAALNVATHAEIDDVIDPADTRARVLRALGLPDA
jgi:acetyl-CoA carboxylase carboxyltransferase component